MTERSDVGSNTLIDKAPELCRLGAAALAEHFRCGTVSPVDVVRATLDQAEAVASPLGAFVSLDHAGALRTAEESARRWRAGAPLSPVDGVPTTIKDVMYVRGWRVRYGSAALEPMDSDQDSPAVARLRAAGAVLIGLTTTPEFGWKAVTDNALDGIVRNPWNSDWTAGGSSGGAAVAAAVGAGVFHLGTDGGGSIRIPAAFCGVTGHKPSFGRVAAWPASAFGTLAHLGPITRTVDDARRMLTVIEGADGRDWSQGTGWPWIDIAAEPLLQNLTIGIWRTPPEGAVDERALAVLDDLTGLLAASGVTTVPFTLPMADQLPDLFRILWFSGAAARVARLTESQRGSVDPALARAVIEHGGGTAARHAAAQVTRADFGAAMNAVFDTVDFVIAPAVAQLPFTAGREVPEGMQSDRWCGWAGFNYPINLSQQPACVVPYGFATDGRPVAVQIIGRRGSDGAVLDLANTVEALVASLAPSRR